jgi:hypothetical protein
MAKNRQTNAKLEQRSLEDDQEDDERQRPRWSLCALSSWPWLFHWRLVGEARRGVESMPTWWRPSMEQQHRDQGEVLWPMEFVVQVLVEEMNCLKKREKQMYCIPTRRWSS